MSLAPVAVLRVILGCGMNNLCTAPRTGAAAVAAADAELVHNNTTPVVTMGVTHGLVSYSVSNGVTPFSEITFRPPDRTRHSLQRKAQYHING